MKRATNVIVVILLSLTSVPTASAALSSEAHLTCSATITKNTLTTVKGQSQALAKKDFKTARSFAAASFRSEVTLEAFTDIITKGYSVLGRATSFKIVECKIVEKLIYLEVSLTDKNKNVSSILYLLEKQSKKELVAPNKSGYGIVAAQLAAGTALKA